MPVEALERMLRTNVLGAMHAARAVVPGMKERQEGGRILFTSSIAGLVGLYGYTGYAATKVDCNAACLFCLRSCRSVDIFSKQGSVFYTCTQEA
jgi:NADP-dependent 3-hydroxy acid dehydrogenase YdfG